MDLEKCLQENRTADVKHIFNNFQRVKATSEMLNIAVGLSNYELVQFFFSPGVKREDRFEASSMDVPFKTAISKCAKPLSGHLQNGHCTARDIVKLLVESSNPQALEYFVDPVTEAAKVNDGEIVMLLIRFGYKITLSSITVCIDHGWDSMLMSLIQIAPNLQTYIQKRQANDLDFLQPLRRAISKGYVNVIEVLLRCKADILGVYSMREKPRGEAELVSPIHCAMNNFNVDPNGGCFNALLRAGADLSICHRNKIALCHYVIRVGNMEILGRLRTEDQFDFRYVNIDRKSWFQVACTEGARSFAVRTFILNCILNDSLDSLSQGKHRDWYQASPNVPDSSMRLNCDIINGSKYYFECSWKRTGGHNAGLLLMRPSPFISSVANNIFNMNPSVPIFGLITKEKFVHAQGIYVSPLSRQVQCSEQQFYNFEDQLGSDKVGLPDDVDTLGFCIDMASDIKTVSFYLNGVQVFSEIPSQQEGWLYRFRQENIAMQFYVKMVSGFVYDFNFCGPFSHAPPSGYQSFGAIAGDSMKKHMLYANPADNFVVETVSVDSGLMSTYSFDWTDAVKNDKDDSNVDVVKEVLRLNHASVAKLADMCDQDGKTALQIARGACELAIKSHLIFLGRYEIRAQPEHISATSCLYLAVDCKTKKTVAIKLIKDKQNFDQEVLNRKSSDLDSKYVINILSTYDDENDLFRGSMENGLAVGYAYCIVMPAASRNLLTILQQENLAGNLNKLSEIQKMFGIIVRCVDHMHSKGILHGDVKPLNIMRDMDGVNIHLIDLDASVNFHSEPVGSIFKVF
jgi:hypothetical protein